MTRWLRAPFGRPAGEAGEHPAVRPPDPHGGPPRAPGRVRVRTLVLTRWFAVAGQLTTLMVISEGLHLRLPMLPAMAAVACSAALNLWLSLQRGLNGWHSDREAAAFLGYDILQLAVLLYLTGGMANPFALLFLVPVTISATILSLGSTIGLGLAAFVCISVLSLVHLPLPWPEPGLILPPLYLLASWTSVALGMLFLMLYAWRVAEESRRMSDALTATQLALSREQELSALGGLAAAAAHELGTPLGTIALVAKELAREVGSDGVLADDIALLNSQADRCREILARLARNPRAAGADQGLAFLPFDALAEEIAEVHRREDIDIQVLRQPLGAAATSVPVVRRSPEMVQGLGNLIENAAEFARAEVRIEVAWSDGSVSLTITDDGPGFAPEVLGVIGEPYISSRPGRGRMGLGVFISKTLLERTGATLRFSNRPRGRGAEVVIVWPRAVIEIGSS
ncbi:MAG TPA: ActS/PrrB/RegB family redox-sensitive histidine kinase [Alphaproteobacteria bacterium]|nr:ActS/PrrB/RegB family redox-sensitive histidine kinase [Alphaproteobacteria bacterium]